LLVGFFYLPAKFCGMQVPQFHMGGGYSALPCKGRIARRKCRHARIAKAGLAIGEGNAMRAIAFFAVVSVATFITNHSQAQDAAAGEKVFAKCKACHVADEDKNKIGPSLNGVIGRTAGTHPGFKYSKPMTEAGASGVRWRLPASRRTRTSPTSSPT
jgi:cytochrome c2